MGESRTISLALEVVLVERRQRNSWNQILVLHAVAGQQFNCAPDISLYGHEALLFFWTSTRPGFPRTHALHVTLTAMLVYIKPSEFTQTMPKRLALKWRSD